MSSNKKGNNKKKNINTSNKNLSSKNKDVRTKKNSVKEVKTEKIVVNSKNKIKRNNVKIKKVYNEDYRVKSIRDKDFAINRIKKYKYRYLLFILILLLIFICIPRIRIVGDKNVNINYDEEYKELGYKGYLLWFDISDKIKVKGNVLNNKVGNYKIEYVYKIGIFSFKKIRNVNVIDNDLPMINIDSSSITLCPNDSYDKINYSANDLYDGDITDKVKIYDDGNKIYFSVSDSSNNSYNKELDFKREDLISPQISLKGDSTVYMYAGTNYSELGYSAFDNCDGDITDKVLVSGEVLNSAGVYYLTYSVTDSSNNQGNVTRKVVVRDASYNNGGSIYLTFDDGPNDSTTGYILDVLRDEGVKATFFVTCGGSDYLIKRMYDEGHTVAIHTCSHDYQYIYSSVDNYLNDFNNVRERIKNITGEYSSIFRFPGGSSNTVSRNYKYGIMSELTDYMLNQGYRYYDWNVDSNDAGGASSSQEVYYNVINSLYENRANMVLMHDVKYTTMGAIRDIINYGKINGYSFERITTDTYMIRHGVKN